MNTQQYLLIKLMEEAAEVQQACAKALRFGLDSTNNGAMPSNLDNIESELKDMAAVLWVMEDTIGIDLIPKGTDITSNKARLFKYMQISKELGTLE